MDQLYRAEIPEIFTLGQMAFGKCKECIVMLVKLNYHIERDKEKKERKTETKRERETETVRDR